MNRFLLRNRRVHSGVLACVMSTLGGCAPNSLRESRLDDPRRDLVPGDTAVFVLRTGNDTRAVDRVARNGNRITGTAVAGRTMKVDYRLDWESTGEVRTYAFLLGPPPGRSATAYPLGRRQSGLLGLW